MESEFPPPPADGAGPSTEPFAAAAGSATEGAPASPEAPAYRDRSTGLVIFGVFQIILGLLAALMIPLVALGAMMSRLGPGGSMRPGQFVSGIASYGFIAATMVALGIGSVQMKRWAYALTLVISWYWMIIGVLITILLTAVLPVTMRTAMQAQANAGDAPQAVTTGVMAVIITVMIVFCSFFLVVAPIAFVVFYSRSDVRLTCQHRDPVERWTDRTPLPVLGASVVLFVGAVYLILVGVTTPMFPFFGRYLTGIPASGCFLALGGLDIYLAAAIFRLKSLAWWIAALLAPVRLLSMVLTYARADLMEAYSKIGFSDAQIRILNANPIFRSHVILWWSLISLFGFFGYLLWLKRYFRNPTAPAPSPVQAS